MLDMGMLGVVAHRDEAGKDVLPNSGPSRLLPRQGTIGPTRTHFRRTSVPLE